METQAAATRKQWIAVIGGLLGAFMAILDISITNSSLKDIQGGLAATLDEGAWISTAYLVSEIIVIPLTGYLSKVFGLKRYLLWNSALFVLASVLCGMARSLPAMVGFRFFQGMTGGVLIPIAVTLILTHLPKRQQPTGMALFSLAATFAPSIGPTIGGWLTTHYAWPWIFFLNLIPGIVLIALISYALEEAPMQLSLLNEGDWFGIATMATALGSLTVVLEEGVRKDWWGSDLIFALSWLSAVSFVIFLYHELKTPKPFINLRLLKRRNFLVASVLATIFGVGLYGSIFMLPFFLASVRNLDAEQIGQVIMWQGLPQLLILPFVPKIMSKVDPRALLGYGFLLFGTSALMNSQLTRDWGFDQFFWSQIVRALGGSIGIGSLGALLDHQYHLHFTRIAEATSRFSATVQEQIAYRLELLDERSPVAGIRQSVATIYGSMNREAIVMSFGDSFLWIGVLFYAGALLLIFPKRPQMGAAADGAH